LLAPRDSATGVPTNSRILIVHGGNVFTLEASTGAPIEAETTLLPIEQGFSFPIELKLLTPVSVLPPDTTIVVKADGDLLGTFATGERPDNDAPTAPALRFVGPYTDGACPPYVEFDIEEDAETAFVIASLSGDNRQAGLSVDAQLVVTGPANETRPVEFHAVDFAGNRSSAVIIDATFPSEFNPGCASSRQSSTDALIAFTLLSLVRFGRRRRVH
jgi:hypothetical protein